VAVEFVKLTTEDDRVLSGRLFGEGNIGVVLAHAWGTDQNSWGALPKILGNRGFTVLTFDFRGHGWSQGPKDIPRLTTDAAAAVRFLENRTDKVLVVGAGAGATAALRAARTAEISGIAALSADDNFRGLTPGSGPQRLRGSKLFMAAAGDDQAADVARALYSQAGEPKEIEIVNGGRSGSDLLRGDKELERLLDWLERTVDD
jgi:pimeloyl-ACP methyl ester carboxylesterase